MRLTEALDFMLSKLCIFAGLRTLGPAVQYLPGEVRVEAGQTLPLLVTHNTVRLRFDLEAAEYLHLTRPDASFPPVQFAMLADERRNQVRRDAATWVQHVFFPEYKTRTPDLQACCQVGQLAAHDCIVVDVDAARAGV